MFKHYWTPSDCKAYYDERQSQWLREAHQDRLARAIQQPHHSRGLIVRLAALWRRRARLDTGERQSTAKPVTTRLA
jgi:hypothetical protein